MSDSTPPSGFVQQQLLQINFLSEMMESTNTGGDSIYFNLFNFSSTNLKRILIGFGGGIFAWYVFKRFFLGKKKKKKTNLDDTKSNIRKKKKRCNLKKPASVWFKILLSMIFSKKEVSLTLVALIILLFLRTLASVKVANMLGRAAELMVKRDVKVAMVHITNFALITIPIAAINSGIRATTELLSIQSREILSKYVHEQYLQDTKVYDVRYWCPEGKDGKRAASIDDAHIRVTRDVAELSKQISGLITSAFKPILDLLVFSTNVKGEMGYQGLAIIWAYYLFVFFVKSKTGPAFAKLSRSGAQLEGYYQSAEQRLAMNAEEVVFFKGATRERGLLTKMLHQITSHGYRTVYTLFGVGVLDQYLAKYMASVAGYITMSVPILLNLSSVEGKSTADLTSAYSRNSRYLLNMGTAIRELALVSNKLGSTYGLVERFAELLERLEHLKKYPKMAPGPKSKPDIVHVESDFLSEWRTKCDLWHPFSGEESIEFDNLTVVSPDRRLLIKDLTLTIHLGEHLLLTGPNGSGKSSIFRVIGGLWPTAAGDIARHPKGLDVFFLTQSPYFVSGNLRDQLIYPLTLMEALHHCELIESTEHYPNDIAVKQLDEYLCNLMDIVDPLQDITRSLGVEEEWTYALSGGQKQLLSMVRLAFHRPCFALLDECTSAVSADKDALVFEICQGLGITMLSISHRHRMHRQYHNFELRLDGVGDGKYTFHPISDAQKKKSRALSDSHYE